LLTRSKQEGKWIKKWGSGQGHLYSKFKLYDRALEQYSLIFELHNEKPLLQLSTTASIARTFFAKEDWRKTLDWTENLKGLAPLNLQEYLYMRAYSHFKMNDLSKAKRSLRELQKNEISVHYRSKVEELTRMLN
jgi:hypothetical protein